MSIVLTTFRSILSRFSTITTPPTPVTIRKYGLLILFLLAAPKIFWDLMRLREFRVKDIEPEGPTDPAIRVLRLALSKALIELKRCWEQVLIPYCQEEIKDITPLVTHFQTIANELVIQLSKDDIEYEEKQKSEKEKEDMEEEKKKKKKKKKRKEKKKNKLKKKGLNNGKRRNKNNDEDKMKLNRRDDNDDDDDDVDDDALDSISTSDSIASNGTDSDNDPGDDDNIKDGDAEDGFLEQWCDTLHNTINKPLYEAFKIKEDNKMNEAQVRSMVRVIIFVGEAFITALKTRRRRNALKKFIVSKEKLLKDHDNEQLIDDNNRNRNKLEIFADGRNQEYAYFISDKDLQIALDRFGSNYDTVTPMKNTRLTPSDWQIECWNDWDTKERWMRYRVSRD
jgi:hypothetical protein